MSKKKTPVLVDPSTDSQLKDLLDEMDNVKSIRSITFQTAKGDIKCSDENLIPLVRSLYYDTKIKGISKYLRAKYKDYVNTGKIVSRVLDNGTE